MEPSQQSSKTRRGFAAMSPERQKLIAKAGGRAAHEQGVAHQWTSEEAKLAGLKGGKAKKTRYSDGNNLSLP